MAVADYTLALILLFIELGLFIAEVLTAARNDQNRKLRRVHRLEKVDFINLSKGYKTSISLFRISLFVTYLVLVVLYLNTSKKNSAEVILFYLLGLILVYMLSLSHIKVFIFYTDYFITNSTFNPFKKKILINYASIKNFYLYRVLYNNFYLKLELDNNETIYIPFSGSSLPKNHLIIRLVLNSMTGMNKDFQRKWKKPKIRGQQRS
jgi:hypothetical protein